MNWIYSYFSKYIGDMGPVHFNTFNSYNNFHKTTSSGITALPFRTLREEPNQINVILQQKLPAAKLYINSDW